MSQSSVPLSLPGKLAAVAPTVSLPGVLRYQVLTGSRAYGLAGPDSDEDWRGFYQLSNEMLWGLGQLPPETVALPPDQVYWELRRFVRLCLAGNPNLIPLLWVEPEFVALTSPLAEALRRRRQRFFSDAMVRAYLGWAQSERLMLTRDPAEQGSGRRLELAGKPGSHLVRILLNLRGALRDEQMQVRLAGSELELVRSIKAGEMAAVAVLEWVRAIEGECAALAERRAWGPVDPAPFEALLLAARRGEL